MPTKPPAPRLDRKVRFHKWSAVAWVAIGIISFVMGWQDLVALVWVASVYANVKSDLGAAEAADDREVLARLDRIEALLNELAGQAKVEHVTE